MSQASASTTSPGAGPCCSASGYGGEGTRSVTLLAKSGVVAELDSAGELARRRRLATGRSRFTLASDCGRDFGRALVPPVVLGDHITRGESFVCPAVPPTQACKVICESQLSA